jgi:hypothetical protein
MTEAAALMIWGLAAHLAADWPLQNDWMANNKAKLGHPAGLVHASAHGLCMLLVFPPLAALGIAVAHYVIDLRWPVAQWSRLIRQTQPSGTHYDIGLEVRFWTDQVFHVLVVAAAALLST